jgi:hypothetical protein
MDRPARSGSLYLLSYTNKAGKVRINATLRCVRASLLPWKTSITYSECVSVAIFSQHAMRMLHIITCGLSGSKVRFHITSLTARFLKKKIIELRMSVLILSAILYNKFSLYEEYSNLSN